MKFTALLISVLVACGAFAASAFAETGRERIRLESGDSVTYFFARPDTIEEGRTYPVVLAFGGGPQTARFARGFTETRLRAAAEQQGYFVISPVAPGGQVFFRGGEDIFPAFFDYLRATYPIEEKFHLMGLSNGGISAFHIAALYPSEVISITSFPGYLWQANAERYQALANICIVMYAGENDTNWVRLQNRDVEVFKEMGKTVYSHVFPGEGHVPKSLSGDGAAQLIQGIEEGWGC